MAEQNAASPNYKTPYKFTGKELDEETGLYYYGARYYDPRIGMFLSVDPLADKYPGMTPYNYTANNPIKFIDVNGDSIDVSILLKIGSMKQSDLVKNVINDLQDISGLSLSIGNNGKLKYDTDKNGKPIYSGGSQEARNFLSSAISDTKTTVNVGYHGSRSFAAGSGMVLSDKQIDGFIKGTSSDLDKRTLGYGMTFLHELDHTILGSGHKDSKVLGTTGKVVDRMNIIRLEMGFKWGQRLSYPAYKMSPGAKDSYLPFNRVSLNFLNKGLIPLKSRIKIVK